MPVIHDIPLSLETSKVLRREGFRGQPKVRPEIKSLIEELLTSVENNHLLEPAVVYEIYNIIEMSHRQLSLEDNLVVPGSLLPSLLPGAKELAVIVGTIGPRLEKQVTGYIQQGEALRGMLLDGIGSAAVDSLTQEVGKLIMSEASSRGYQVSSPVYPGAPGFSISEQWNLLELVNTREIGVSLTSSGMMVPRKSTSMVMGIGLEMPTWTEAEACANCSLGKTCPYRVSA